MLRLGEITVVTVADAAVEAVRDLVRHRLSKLPLRHQGRVSSDGHAWNGVQGSITKAGNAHARRLLIESAGRHRQPYRNPSPTMRARPRSTRPSRTVGMPATDGCISRGAGSPNERSLR